MDLKPCQHCGTPMPCNESPAHYRRRKYCSLACANGAVNDAYVRTVYGLPTEASALVLEALRTHILLTDRKRKSRSVLPVIRAARFVPGRAASGSP